MIIIIALEFQELCEHAPRTPELKLHSLLLLFFWAFYFTAHSIYMIVCTVVTHSFAYSRDNRIWYMQAGWQEMTETKLDWNSKLLGGSQNRARKRKDMDMHCEADKNMHLGIKTANTESLVRKISTSSQSMDNNQVHTRQPLWVAPASACSFV